MKCSFPRCNKDATKIFKRGKHYHGRSVTVRYPRCDDHDMGGDVMERLGPQPPTREEQEAAIDRLVERVEKEITQTPYDAAIETLKKEAALIEEAIKTLERAAQYRRGEEPETTPLLDHPPSGEEHQEP